MAARMILFAVALMVVGIAGYMYTGMVSVTALIPAFLGVVFVALGLLARNPERERFALLIAMLLAGGGLIPKVPAMLTFVASVTGSDIEPSQVVALSARTAVALGFILFILLGISLLLLNKKKEEAPSA